MMNNLWTKVWLHLAPDTRKILACIQKSCTDCVDLDDPMFDEVCGKEKCKLEYVLRKFCGINCKCSWAEKKSEGGK